MHVLTLALRTGFFFKLKQNLHINFFLAKWLSHSFNRKILRKKERGRRPSCPPGFDYLKRQLELSIFYESFH